MGYKIDKAYNSISHLLNRAIDQTITKNHLRGEMEERNINKYQGYH